MKLKWFCLLTFVTSLTITETRAEPQHVTNQSEEDTSEDPTRGEWAILPAISANSDIGFAFGALTFYSRMDPNYKPYRWQCQAQFKMSVKDSHDGLELPLHDHFIKFDSPQLFDGKLRIYVAAGYIKNIIAGWYGLGNDTDDDDQDIDRRFQFITQSPYANIAGRTPIWRDLSVFGSIKYKFSDIGLYAGSKLEEDILRSKDGSGEDLFGYDNASKLEFQAGVIWDSRDDETNPLKGSFHEFSLRGSPGALTAADHNFAGINLSTRNFFSLYKDYLVLAFRFTGDLLMGDVPFYELAQSKGLEGFDALGSQKGVRGVPARRYNGKVKLFGNLELRSVFYRFKIVTEQFGLGWSLFFDAGRVWYNLKSNPELDGDGTGIKFGVGGGPQILWGKSVVIRFDIAYSPDADPIGFYIEAGRVF